VRDRLEFDLGQKRNSKKEASGNVTAKCRTRLPTWVKSRHGAPKSQCPLFTQKRTSPGAAKMSALCQKRTSGHSYSISWSARESSVRRCAGFCAAVRPMCRFLSVLRSLFVLYVRFVELEKMRHYSYLPSHWGIVQR
jgi:hypothetical protein